MTREPFRWGDGTPFDIVPREALSDDALRAIDQALAPFDLQICIDIDAERDLYAGFFRLSSDQCTCAAPTSVFIQESFGEPRCSQCWRRVV